MVTRTPADVCSDRRAGGGRACPVAVGLTSRRGSHAGERLAIVDIDGVDIARHRCGDLAARARGTARRFVAPSFDRVATLGLRRHVLQAVGLLALRILLGARWCPPRRRSSVARATVGPQHRPGRLSRCVAHLRLRRASLPSRIVGLIPVSCRDTPRRPDGAGGGRAAQEARWRAHQHGELAPDLRQEVA
jgi:hypothetical protein